MLNVGGDPSHYRSLAIRLLFGIEALSILTSIHHLNQLGISFLVPAVLVVGLPIVCMWWFLNALNQAARWTYGAVVALVIVGFGLGDGLWNHTIKMIVFFSRGATRAAMVGLPFPPVGSAFHEITGVLTFIAAIVAAYVGWQFMAETGRLPVRRLMPH
jgi:hypothetical protein